MTRARRALKIEREIDRLIAFLPKAPIGTRRDISKRILKLRTLAMSLVDGVVAA